MEEITFPKEIWLKLKKPWKPFNWAFFIYLIFILIGIGGLGIWVNTYNVLNSSADDHQNIAIAIATFAITLMARSSMDLNLLVDLKNRISMHFASVVFLGFAVLIFWLSHKMTSNYVFIPAIAGFIVAILLWYIANVDSDKFNEKVYYDKIMEDAKEKHGANWSK